MSTIPEQLGFFDDALYAPRPHEYPMPSGERIVKCLSCKASIVWTQTKRGASVPLALDSVVTRDGKQWAQSHYLTCPQASGWGKR
jgi:hypothetical protein